MNHDEDKDWLGWKALVAVSSMPAACGFAFWMGKSQMTFTGDGIIQGLCTIIGATIGFAIVSWQVKKTFESTQRLTDLELARDFRKGLRPLKQQVHFARSTVQALVDVVGRDANDRRPMDRNLLQPLQSFEFTKYWDELCDAENNALETAFLEMNAQLQYLSHLFEGPLATTDNQLAQCQRFIDRANTFDEQFARAFPVR